MTERRARLALRELDEARIVVKWARAQFVVSMIAVAAVIGLWALHLSNDYNGAGYVWKVIGLVPLAIAVVSWCGISGAFTANAAKERRKAEYEYQDAVLGDEA